METEHDVIYIVFNGKIFGLFCDFSTDYLKAYKLVNKTTFPETASNNEWARFLYYLGRIKAIQLEYTEAHKNLVQSLRKAPQKSALGFRHTVLKLSITVELLLGNIPERQTFLQPLNKKALAPYLLLTQGMDMEIANFTNQRIIIIQPLCPLKPCGPATSKSLKRCWSETRSSSATTTLIPSS